MKLAKHTHEMQYMTLYHWLHSNIKIESNILYRLIYIPINSAPDSQTCVHVIISFGLFQIKFNVGNVKLHPKRCYTHGTTPQKMLPGMKVDCQLQPITYHEYFVKHFNICLIFIKTMLSKANNDECHLHIESFTKIPPTIYFHRWKLKLGPELFLPENNVANAVSKGFIR